MFNAQVGVLLWWAEDTLNCGSSVTIEPTEPYIAEVYGAEVYGADRKRSDEEFLGCVEILRQSCQV
jgi:hypothetical protein